MTVGLRLLGALTLMVAVVASPRRVDAQSDGSRRSLQGTWRVTVSPYSCDTGAPLGFSFHAVLAFARGGTLGGASAVHGQPGQFSPSFGVWQHTEHRTYRAVTDAFIFFTGGPFRVGRQEITQTIELSPDGDRFTDAASVNYFDVNDVPLQPQPP